MRAIQYLGSKLNVKNEIATIIKNISKPNNIIVDAFAGTGVIGNELKLSYKIISNDIQKYSSLINKILLSSTINKTIMEVSIKNDILENENFKKNINYLSDIFRDPLKKEKEIIESNNFKILAEFISSQLFYDGTNYIKGMNLEFDKTYKKVLKFFNIKNIEKIKKNRDYYMLFSLYYLNGYFSLFQCNVIDSVRYAIDKTDNEEKKQYLLFLLLHAISEVTCSVGKQFAQPLKIKDKNLKIKELSAKRCIRDWKLDIIEKMENMHKKFSKEIKIGSYMNEVYNLDVDSLLSILKEQEGLIYYLDPPYTIEHYSRFYHVLEVLVDYNYPKLEKKIIKGKECLLNGRYPINRFQSPLSIISKAKDQFEIMFKTISESDSKLVLSYSDAENEGRSRVVTRDDLIKLLEKYFKKVEIFEIEHNYKKLNKEELNITEKSTRELVFVGENNG